jgi:hypothetical protein
VQTDFIALYRGQTVADARLVAITAEPELVSKFFRELEAGTDRAKENDELADREALRVLRGGDDE